MKRVASLACAALVLAAPSVVAQEQAAAVRLADKPESPPLAFRPAPAPFVEVGSSGAFSFTVPVGEAPDAEVRVEALETMRRQSGQGGRSVVHTVGGAIVGAWLGYFTSQVAKSDWSKHTNAEVMGHRAAFALGGAVVGGVGGLFLGTRSSTPLGSVARQARPGRDMITQEQVDAAQVATAYDLVQTLHPEWLRTRGTNSFSEGSKVLGALDDKGTPLIVAGTDALVVYMNDARLGGPEMLRQIAAFDVGTVSYLTPAEATYRWGMNHSHGAIWVTTRR